VTGDSFCRRYPPQRGESKWIKNKGLKTPPERGGKRRERMEGNVRRIQDVHEKDPKSNY